jgi:N-acyl-D-aspartate/D-glutamate deacylase
MSEFDLVVRSGTVVDGTGSAARTADVAIAGGRIAQIGRVLGRGRSEVDADGALVLPGFVDVHTHYDGQATWEQSLAPSSWHGVTTVVMGNCGVGFAPASPEQRTRLIELMEGVEDIPGVALTEGLTWEWESFPQFLDEIDRPHDIDFAAQVPHAAVRVYAMGDRAAAKERATAEEVAVMAGLVREAILAGAIGFSTSRTLNHKSVNGEVTPSYDAGADELVAIAAAIGETGTGVMQVVSAYPDPVAEFAIFRRMVQASARPLSVTVGQRHDTPETYREILALIEQANADGLPIVAQVPVRGIGVLLGLQNTLHPFMVNPVWRRIADLPVAEQALRMRDPHLRAEILAAQTGEKNTDLIGGDLIDRYGEMFELTDPPDYEPSPDRTLAAVAARTGRTPEEIAYDVLASDDGRAMLYLIFNNYAAGNLDVARELLTSEHSVPSLSDGGAHVGTICDASFPTTLLTHWARDRVHGRLDLPYVVRRQCRDTARLVGLLDRGVLAPGYRADLNVVDLPGLRLHRPEMHFDLPAGGRRLMQRVDGYRHTFVAGVETYRDGQPTGELPGRLVRGPRTG